MGFDREFVADLTRPLGVDKMVVKIEKEKYSLRGISASDKTFEESPAKSTKRKDVVWKEPSGSSVRIRSMDLHDFRGMREIEGGIDLSGDVVFIYGPNGTGKTSLFDALEWAVTGSVERLSWDPDEAEGGQDSLVNLFSADKTAQVRVELSTGDQVARDLTIDGILTNTVNGRPAKEDQVMKAFVRNAAPLGVDKGLLRRLVRHSHFLGQHSIREFISGGSDSLDPAVYRFRVLSQLFGRQDFVRANDKLDRLIKKLDANVFNLKEQLRLGTEQLQIIRRSIREHRTALADRQAAAKVGPLSSELESFKKRLLGVEIYQAGTLDAGVEAPTAIGSYLVEIEAALDARSENLQKDQGRVQRLMRELSARSSRLNLMKDLVTQLGELERQIDKKQKEQAELDTAIKVSEGQALAARIVENELDDVLKKTDWLLNNGPRALDARKRLSDLQKTLGHLEANIAGLERERNALVERTDALKKELATKNSELKSLAEKRERLRKLENALPSLREALGKLTNYLSQENLLSAQLTKEEEAHALLIEQLKITETDLARAEEELAISSQSKERKDSLAAGLAEYLDSKFCPLCGHDHESKELLRKSIDQQLLSAPPTLVQMASKKERLQKQSHDLHEQARTAQQLVASVSSQRNEYKQLADKTRAMLASWRLEAIQVGVLANDDELEEFTKIRNINLQDDYYLALSKAVDDLKGLIEVANRGITGVAEKHQQLQSEVNQSRVLARRVLLEIETFEEEAQKHNAELDGYKATVVQKARHSAFAELEVAKEKTRGIIERVTSQKEVVRKSADTLETLQVSHGKVKKEQNLLFEQEDALNGLLSAEQLPIQATEQAVHLKLEQVSKDLDTCAELQKQRARLYEAVSIEALREDIGAENKRLKEETEKLAPTEARIAIYTSWTADLKECKEGIGSEQKKTVEQQIEELEPTLNKIWKRLSPHPVFDDIKMEIVKSKGKDNALRMKASVDGSTIEIGGKALLDVPPSSYFSEAQMNVMAVSIFLAIAVRQSWSGLRLIAIDDPVQQMDDLNANAFFDLIRGLVPSGHQFLIATCDQQLYRMALEKFACLNLEGKPRFIGYRLKGVSRKGPQLIKDAPIEIRPRSHAELHDVIRPTRQGPPPDA
jgi:DNA repair exonuclease SbcCD ATPase subunit